MRRTLVRILEALALLAAFAAGAWAAPVAVDVDLPSSSASGGTLALRVHSPGDGGESRYPEGAPVVVFVPGGFTAGGLDEPLPGARDTVRITFLMPGGRDRVTGRTSGGTFDDRGERCVVAVRDVVRFAAGLLRDSRGRTIGEVVPVPVLTDVVGLLGASNGGNLVAVAAADPTVAGRLRFVVQWESPVSSQVVVSDGGRRFDCGGERSSGLRGVDPFYRGYGQLELDVDYARIAHEARGSSPVFLDGSGDGRYTTATDASGCTSPDTNRSGALEAFEDFPLSAITVAGRSVYSRPATRALAASGAFGGAWPPDVATLAEAEAIWDLREAVRWCGPALAAVPGLAAMVLASVEDHVQVMPGNPHIRQAFECWQGAGAWVRINPGREYLSAGSGGAIAPENEPNQAPRDWDDVTSWAVPETVSGEALQAAAVREMADRARAGR